MTFEEITERLDEMAQHHEICGQTFAPDFSREKYQAWGQVLRDAVAKLRTHPDAQPNEPLTLEELREMDGQPVWIDRGPGYGAGWVLVQVWAKSTNIIYLIQANGSVLQLGVEIKNGAKFYRRPPKEEK